MAERATDNEGLISQGKGSKHSVEQESNLDIPSPRRTFSATRKRGKCMSRRAGQNPSVRMRLNRTKGIKEYFFQYWIDVPGKGRTEKRNRNNRTCYDDDEERGGPEEIGVHFESKSKFECLPGAVLSYLHPCGKALPGDLRA